jgi:branched-chain amino acid transport system permease protein
VTVPRFIVILGAFCVALLPLTGAVFYMQLLSKIMILAIFAMSLDLLVGCAGLVSLGHAAFFGVAGYVIALLSPKYQAASLWLTLPAAMIISATLALLIGLLVLRTSGIYFIMVTLAFGQMLYYLFHDTKLGGGSDGIYLYVKPELKLVGSKLLDLEKPLQFYYFVFGIMVAVYFLLQRILVSPFGRALAGLSVNERRMRSLGFPVFSYKLGAFVLSGTLAGLAGYLSACQFGFVNPEILSWHYSATVLILLIFGGIGRLYGAIVGAFAYVLLQELLASHALFGALAKHWQLGMGALIMLVVIFLPSGLTSFFDRFGRVRLAQASDD